MMHKNLTRYLFIFYTLCFYNAPLQAKTVDDRFISQAELHELISEARLEQSAAELSPEEMQEIRSVNPKTSWTFIVYMAADNDLHYFAWKNLKQMELIGSNPNVSIVVQLNTPGYLNPTKRYIVKKGRRLLVQDDNSPTQKLNSGIPSTLVDCVSWAVSHYPADNYALIMWNHGSGDVDPNLARTINPCDLFYLNPTDNKLEIDRGASYLALICAEAKKTRELEGKRGICFDDTFKTYLSNHDLEAALKEISQNVLGGKKLGIIGFDACLMSMVGVASICKNYAQYMVSSQEIEYGTGWKYDLILEKLARQSMSPKDLASHIVLSYEQAYQKLISDYTMSAIDLSLTKQLENNIHLVAQLLHEALLNQKSRSVFDIIRKCKSTQYCTCFDEPSYIDLGHFYQNLQEHMQHIILTDSAKQESLQNKLKTKLSEGLAIISSLVIENKVGPKLKNALGISIYFPEHAIASSYPKSPFALQNNWYLLLSKYILG